MRLICKYYEDFHCLHLASSQIKHGSFLKPISLGWFLCRDDIEFCSLFTRHSTTVLKFAHMLSAHLSFIPIHHIITHGILPADYSQRFREEGLPIKEFVSLLLYPHPPTRTSSLDRCRPTEK